MQGEGGCYPGTREFFLPLIKLCKENNIAIFVDEIQSFGRGETLFATDHFGLNEFVDVLTVGKLLQVCATLYTDEYRPLPGLNLTDVYWRDFFY